MHAHIQQLGSDLLCRAPLGQPPELRLEGEAARASLEGWAQGYGSAVRANDTAALLAIGREMFAWLDATGWATAWARATGPAASASPGARPWSSSPPAAALGRTDPANSMSARSPHSSPSPTS